MKRIIRYLSFIFYLLLGIVNLIMGLYMVSSYMNSQEFSIVLSIGGTCLLTGSIACFYIVTSIGGRLSHDLFCNSI